MTPDPTDILARTIWGEARNQGRAGMVAVACVIRNRAQHPRWWGHDIASVCLDPWQFSCWNADDPNRSKLLAVTGSDPNFTIALSVAESVIAGNVRDPTGGADSYFTDSITPPAWARRASFICQIGAHRFYRVELPAPETMIAATPEGLPDAPCMSADALNTRELSNIRTQEV